MADREISELTAADTLDGDELVHIDQGGNSRKATLSSVVALSTGAMLVSEYDPNDDGIIAVAQGGTNAATASAARTNLGLGTIAVQNAATVAITGGSVTGITDLAVADGGTGGSDASTARTNLGLAIGTDVQAYSANLAGFAATTVANVQNRVNHTGTQLAATISDFSTASDLRIAAAVDVTVQAYSATLDDWSAIDTADKLDASVIPAAEDGKILSWTGTSLVNKTAGELGTFIVGEDVQAYSANLDAWSALATSAKQDASANLTAWSAIATSTKQAASANLTTLAGITPGAAGQAILADATAADVKSYLDIQSDEVEFTNQNGSSYVARALENVIGEGNTRLRDALGDGVSPTATEWTAALQKSHDDLKSTCGNVHFAEIIELNDTVNWDGYVSLLGNAFGVPVKFSEPEGQIGAIIKASSTLDLGLYDDSGGVSPAFYEFANGLINVEIDNTILSSNSRPRTDSRFERFGMIGNDMVRGSGIRVLGTMRVHFKNLTIAHFPDWGIQIGSNHGLSPGSSNGCTAEDLFIASCGGNSSAAADDGGGLFWSAPDGYLGSCQLGGNVGVGMTLQTGNVILDNMAIWNNQQDQLRFIDANGIDFRGSIYEGSKTNVAILGDSYNISLDGHFIFPNVRAATAGRDASNIYVHEDFIRNLRINGLIAASFDNIRYDEQTAWAASTVVPAGASRVNANKRYTTVAGGTTGSTAPTHTSGSVSDGGVTWAFANGYGLYGIYDDGGSSETGSMGISESTIIDGHRTAPMRTFRRNITGQGARIRTAASSASPTTLFIPGDTEGIWEVTCYRASTNQDCVTAFVRGGATPVIFGKVQQGTSVDLAISGANLQVTTTSGSTVTIVATWKRKTTAI